MEEDIEKMQDFIMLLRAEPEDNPKAFLEIDYESQKELAQTIENLINKYKEQEEQIEEYKLNVKEAMHEAQENARIFRKEQAKANEYKKMIELMALSISSYDSQLVINTFKDKEDVKEFFIKKAR